MKTTIIVHRLSEYETHCTVCRMDRHPGYGGEGKSIHQFLSQESYSYHKSDHDMKLKRDPKYDHVRNEYYCSEPQYKILQVMEEMV